MALEYLEGGIVIKASSIELFHEIDAKVGEGVEDLDDDELVVVYPVSDGRHSRLAIERYKSSDWADEFQEERKVVEW